ncbi:hypothetical protein BC835DRAFT_1415859 [Cytidiella melzeri]|nr:hypothetical protein BC835DRAFT_1415859 [Cytidiella melzeri]
MKYRSPSPVIGGALPTPPHSPSEGTMVPKAALAASMLDNLCSFYQQERYWVHHTRASLELALAKGIDGSALLCAAPSEELQGAPSPASSTTTLCDGESQNTINVKPDPDAESTSLLLMIPDESPEVRAPIWLRRKNKQRLRLEGINSHPHRNTSSKPRHSRPLRAPSTEPGARLLEMFSELVDARMESSNVVFFGLMRHSSSCELISPPCAPHIPRALPPMKCTGVRPIYSLGRVHFMLDTITPSYLTLASAIVTGR